jgi:hypothetical protein
MLPILLLAAMVAIGQAPARPAPATGRAPAPAVASPRAPERSAEIQKLGAFLGEWRMKDDPPDSPNRTICQWAPNGQCLLCDQIHPGPEGPGKPPVRELNIFTYDRGRGRYVMQGLRPARSAQFMVTGTTWTYPGEFVENGKTVAQRVLNTWETPGVMHFTVQVSQDNGAHWTTQTDGRMVRTKEAPATAAPAKAGTSTPPALAVLTSLVGTWRVTGARKATAASPADAVSATSTCGWSPNGAFLVCDQIAANGTDVISVYSYTEADQRFHFQSLSPHGGTIQHLDLSVTDRLLTYNGTFSNGAMQAHLRLTKTVTAPGAMHYKEEVSADGATWIPRGEGDETKVR